MLVVVLASAVAGAAYAVATTKIVGNLNVTGVVKAKDFRFSKPKAAVLNVAGAAFNAESNVSDDVDHDGFSGEVRINSGDAVAPIDLPQGAVVTQVSLVYAPTASDGDITLHLESNIAANGHSDMVILESAAACVTDPCTATTTSVSPDTINNKVRSYGLWLSNGSGGTVIVYAVRITYTLTRVGPAGRTVTGTRVAGTIAGHN